VQSAPAATESESKPRRRRSCSRRAAARQSPAARRRAAAWRRKNCPRSPRHRARGDEGQDRKRSVGERRRRASERRAALEEVTAKKREQCQPAVAGELVSLDRIGQCRGTLDGGPTLVGRLASKPLPDPLPPGSRLDGGFAQLLVRTAGPQWPLVLASLRAQGNTGPAPAGQATIAELAKGLREADAEERVQGLADYHRAAGIEGLTQGLTAVKGQLIKRVLSNPKISIYEGGRSDIASGDIDVRPLVVMLYLAERQGGVMVSSLVTGHGVFTKSGGVSLHSFGRAMDISAVAGVPILGHQQPGGVTESALRNILMLPAELQPSELISLFAMGGPSFALADHADHIHVGY